MSDAAVKIAIKPATGGEAAKFSVTVERSNTVLELKEEVAKHAAGVPAADMRLIYKGQVMKDERTVDDYGVQNDHVVHMGGLSGMLDPDNPLMQTLLGNPDLMRTIMLSNPQMQRVMQSNPEIAQIFNNPEIMREAVRLMQNPNLMREHARNNDVAMRNIEGMPEGFNALRRMYESMEPMMQGGGFGGGLGGGGAGSNPFSALLGGAGGATAAAATPTQASDRAPEAGPNNAPLPNPWSPQPPAPGVNPLEALAGLSSAGGAGGVPGALDPAAALAMMRQPGMQAAMQQVLSNPAVMQTLANRDPNMRNLLETVPGMREAIADPNMLRAVFNSDMINAVLSRAQADGRMPPDVPMPLPAGGANGPDLSHVLSLLGGGAGGGLGGGAGGLGGLDLASLLGGGMPGLGVPPVSNPEEAYNTELQQLADMGFVDRAANIRALSATQGNVNAAVERLLGGGF